MSLQFVLGRAGSGKSEYCIKKAAQLESTGRRVIMLVPEQYSHSGESAFIREKGYICDDFNVTSFNRLARKIIKDAGITRLPADSSGKAMLILKAIHNCKSKLTFYKNTADKHGCLKLFKDAISEFKKGQIIPEALSAAAKKASEPSLSARLLDLSLILEEYNKLLREDFCDSDDNLTVAAALCFDSEYIKNSVIFIDEFYRFTQNEISCINSFLSAGAEVVVSLCMPADNCSNIFKSVSATKSILEHSAANIGAVIKEPVVLPDAPRFLSKELSYLEKVMSSKTLVPYNENVSDITIHIAKGRYDEVTHIAAKIKNLVVENNISYKDIAVVSGNYDSYKDLVGIIFPMYDIPVFLDTRHDFLSHPIVVFLFSLFDLLGGISTKKVVSYMKSGFADIEDNLASRLENYALSGAIEYADWQNDERFLRKAKGVFEKEDSVKDESIVLKDAKNRMLKPVFDLKDRMMHSKNLKDRANAIKDFFEEITLAEKIEEKIKKFKVEGLLREADEFADVYNILTETFETMIACLGEHDMGISAIREILEAGLSEKSIGVIPTVYDQVSFGDLNRSLIKNSRILFVLGVNDGIFPALPTQDILLSDNEREFLISEGISVAPESKKRILDSEYSVYSVPLSVREKLFLSYSIADDNGSGMRPAMFISKLKRFFPKIPITHELNLNTQSAKTTVASKQSAYNYILTNIKNLDQNKIAGRLYNELIKDEEYREKLERAKAFSNYVNTSGSLSKSTVTKLYGSNLYGSVSRFERYASCPFSFFIEYGLRAKERKILKIDTPDMGSLLHEIVERFSIIMKKSGLSFRTISQEKQHDIVDSLIDEMFGAMFIRNIYSEKRILALKKRLKSLVSKSIWAICEHISRGKFEPAAFELSFDKNGDLPPFTVPLPSGGTVTLTGRIDRVDTFTHDNKLYLKIIDYKSGSKKYSLSDIFNGTTLQLALYSYVVIEEVRKKSGKETEFGGMFYFHLDDPVLESLPESGNDKNSILKTFKMTGLSSSNYDVICATDGEINGASIVIPVYLKNDGTISDARSSTADTEKFKKLTQHISNVISKIGQEIIDGKIDILPVKNKSSLPCSYCKYLSVCGFDPSVNKCRKRREFPTDEDFWNEM